MQLFGCAIYFGKYFLGGNLILRRLFRARNSGSFCLNYDFFDWGDGYDFLSLLRFSNGQ